MAKSKIEKQNKLFIYLYGLFLSLCIAFGTWGPLYLNGLDIWAELVITATVAFLAGVLMIRKASSWPTWIVLVVLTWAAYGWAVFNILPDISVIPFLIHPLTSSVTVAAGLIARRIQPNKFVWRLVPVGLGAVAVVGIFFLQGPLNAWGKAWVNPGRWQPKPFALQLINGKQIASQTLSGETVVLSFWATWCGPCRAELPALQRLYKSHYADKEDIRFYLVNVNSGKKAASKAEEWLEKFDIVIPTALDPQSELAKHLKTSGIVPVLIVLGPNGNVRLTKYGYSKKHNAGFPKLRATIENIHSS